MVNRNTDKKKDGVSTTLMPDILVVEKILEGQTELFEILIRRYNELLYRTIRSYTDIEADVEDAMQDAYVKAFQIFIKNPQLLLKRLSMHYPRSTESCTCSKKWRGWKLRKSPKVLN